MRTVWSEEWLVSDDRLCLRRAWYVAAFSWAGSMIGLWFLLSFFGRR
jgi:hypothetical protein